MELAIFTIFLLLIVVVLQWAQFRRILKQKNDEIARMHDINHGIANRMWGITTENSRLKALLGKKV